MGATDTLLSLRSEDDAVVVFKSDKVVVKISFLANLIFHIILAKTIKLSPFNVGGVAEKEGLLCNEHVVFSP